MTVVYVLFFIFFIFLPLQHFCTSVLQRYKYLLECESDVVSFSLIHGRKKKKKNSKPLLSTILVIHHIKIRIDFVNVFLVEKK